MQSIATIRSLDNSGKSGRETS